MINRVSGGLCKKKTVLQNYLSGPQVELFEGWQLNKLLSTGTGDIGEGQTQVFKVPKGARAQQAGKISVLNREDSTVKCIISYTHIYYIITKYHIITK